MARLIVAALALAACGGPPPARPIEQRTVDAPVSPQVPCGGPAEAIGVCTISADGVTVQARDLRAGANATFQLDVAYGESPPACHARWRYDDVVDAGGVVTARFDIPATDACALRDSMIVRVRVDPDGLDLGPQRFGTLPPP